MPPVKKAGTPRGAGRTSTPKLPPVTVARLEETGRLLERIVATNQTLFVERGQAYKDIHREGSRRPLTPLEAAQVATVLAAQATLEAAQEVQDSTLRAYDEPDAREILFSAGLGVAPAFITAVRQAVALVEMAPDAFKEARETGDLETAIDAAARELEELEVSELRSRAAAAFAHYAKSAGFEPGEAWSLPFQAVRQALANAMTGLLSDSRSSQLIDSAASTADSPEAMSSTSSGGPTPSN